MIEEIRISSLGVIDATVLELGPGLTVITGETGAGKTMVVTALGLLLGGRADTGAVRTGAKQARVEGVVNAAGLPGFIASVEDAGGEVEDGVVVLARNVSAEGRSRAFVGGATVPVATLTEVAEPLVAVHGQSDQHRLLLPRAQRDAVDRFGGPRLAKILARYTDLYRRLDATSRELDDVVASSRERAREADLLRFGLGEVEAVSPEPGEDDALAAEESRLGYADTLRAAAEHARTALSGDESGESGADALGTTAAARGFLESVREHDPEVAELADRMAEVVYLVSDVAADVASYADRVDTDPHRLAAVSERRAALTALTRKYGETLEEVLAWSARAATRLLDLDGTDERIEALTAERDRLRSELGTAAAALSKARTTAARTLEKQVTAELTLLAMPHAVLSIRVTPTEPAAHGADDVQLLLAANTGSEPRPLSKGASGGELSRVMLAIEVALAGTSPVPTFVFDEVDAGVGGAAAVEVGRRLAELARTAQVLVVTHLPQVAAYADRHVLVQKSSDGSVTSSGLTVLDDAARERELSRMLAGLADSDTALAHARELLDVAQVASRTARGGSD
ncbi:DNA repair protein RecN [Nocardioides dongxiaopingii]|uniref:DNA repair protein RecN n=1 Tax=Nocardioides dongxiaopingii TaxID=2576036 RepID=UPI0010C76F22|nr:DNA repair protein RecN [Nocardioides dongxiaopingii]